MQRTLLRAKLHRLHVTHSELHYEGSVAIDGKLLEAADICEYERIEVYNVTNGERFSTYAIRAEDDSGVISVNGAAAHKASPGDIIIICSFAVVEEKELAQLKPRMVYVDENNHPLRISHSIPVQAA